jgi:hypothetical protein
MRGAHGAAGAEAGGQSRPARPAPRPAEADDHPVHAPITHLAAAPDSASRQMPRVPQEDLTCNLGEVAELGADSIRVFCAKPPRGNEVKITFSQSSVDIDFDLRAQVTWSKKSGRRHDVGLKFLDLTPPQQKRLLRVAMEHRKVTTMTDGD